MKKLFIVTQLFAFLIIYLFIFSSNTSADEEENDATSFSVTKWLLIDEEGEDNDQKSFFENECVKNVNVSVIGCYAIRLVNILTVLIGIASFAAIVIGGLTLVTAGGNDTQIGKGKDTIFYAIIGLVVTLSAYIISVFVQSIFY